RGGGLGRGAPLGEARPRDHRRRQGPGRRGQGGPRRAGPPRPAARGTRQGARGAVPARPLGSDRPAADLLGAVPRTAAARRGPTLPAHVTTPPALAAADTP